MGNKDAMKNVFFHVVNSVKGGSGKSLFAFALAHTLTWEDENAKVFVVDLDLRGSSWIIKYEKNIFRKNGGPSTANENVDYPYIDRLFMQFDHFESNELWAQIRIKKDSYSDKESMFYLCAADDQYEDRMDDIEVDMFEETVFKLIMNGLNMADGKNNNIHFIFDMPPSYERHAERILKHLLTSKSSALFNHNAFNDSLPKEQKYNPYKIYLYMMAAVSGDHVRQNRNYLIHWIKQRTYSSAMIGLMKNERLYICPILNDLTNVVLEDRGSSLCEEANRHMNDIKTFLASKQDGNKMQTQIGKYQFIEHCGSKTLTQLLPIELKNKEAYGSDKLDTLTKSVKEILCNNKII